MNTTPCITTPDIVQGELYTRKRVSGLTWAEMAALPEYSPIPQGTLCAIANGADIPKKWYRKLGITLPRSRCLRPETIEVNKHCAKSAAKSLRKCYFTIDELMEELKK